VGQNRQSWEDVILQGPHLFRCHHRCTRRRNKTHCLHKPRLVGPRIFESFCQSTRFPMTGYKAAGRTGVRLRPVTTTPLGVTKNRRSAREFYRLAWRNMAANKNERTLHSGTLFSAGCGSQFMEFSSVGLALVVSRSPWVVVAAFASSLFGLDLFVRTRFRSRRSRPANYWTAFP